MVKVQADSRWKSILNNLRRKNMAALTVSKEDEKRVKGLGFLSNKRTDNFSGRVITVNGKLTADEQIREARSAQQHR